LVIVTDLPWRTVSIGLAIRLRAILLVGAISTVPLTIANIAYGNTGVIATGKLPVFASGTGTIQLIAPVSTISESITAGNGRNTAIIGARELVITTACVAFIFILTTCTIGLPIAGLGALSVINAWDLAFATWTCTVTSGCGATTRQLKLNSIAQKLVAPG
tara:strand:+ start:379 stop:861 length:483 start_codon:yes stop_codon:yes gene_type:complete